MADSVTSGSEGNGKRFHGVVLFLAGVLLGVFIGVAATTLLNANGPAIAIASQPAVSTKVLTCCEKAKAAGKACPHILLCEGKVGMDSLSKMQSSSGTTAPAQRMDEIPTGRCGLDSAMRSP